MNDNSIPLGVLTPKPRGVSPAPDKPKGTPPRVEILLTMLENAKTEIADGGDIGSSSFIQLVLKRIEDFKMPYRIDYETFTLKSILTRGEQYLDKFITVDEKMLRVKSEAQMMSACDYEVLIHGETGTGKESLAQSMIGTRDGNIRAVNCAGLPSELIESELFGYAKGAFTGAESTKDGLIKQADGGLMFLDEIGELPLAVQAKLLRVISERQVRKVGGSKEEPVTCKFVFATNRDLGQMVKDKLFREDLYARIFALQLNTTPLRERVCDIEPICLSMKGGREFYDKHSENLKIGVLDLSLNVRSLIAYMRRFEILGRVV